MLIALILVIIVGLVLAYFAITSTIMYLAMTDRLYEAEKYNKNLVDAARAVIPLLPDKSVDSFYAEGSFTERQALRSKDMASNEAIARFLAWFKPAQSLEDSAMAYERFFGYSSAQGVANAKATGQWSPTGGVLQPGPMFPGPDYSLEAEE
jgi:hypothetical protein